MMKKDQQSPQVAPHQGVMYPPQQHAMYQQPHYAPQPQFVQQPAMQAPQYAQQPVMQAPPQYFQQPAMQQSAPQYRPVMPSPQQVPYRPSYPSGPSMPRYAPLPFSAPVGYDPAMSYENDAFLANLTGWSPQDIDRLRREFSSYANPMGVIDREGFRKIYVASLLNMTWDAVEHEAEAAFRNFDINQTGFLDFNEYITACSRMSRELNAPYPSSPPPMNPPYNY